MYISPDVGRSSPAIIRSSVVLPEPEEPSRTRNSPSRIERSTPSTAWSSAKCFLRFRISTPATVGPLPPRLAGVGRRIRLLRQVHRRGGDDVVRARRGPEGVPNPPRGGRRPPPPGAGGPPPPPRPPPPEGAPPNSPPPDPRAAPRVVP